jgi:sugar (pentulose or hexulose) kinase
LGGVASGAFGSLDEAVGRCVRVADRIEPDAEWSAAYAAGYERFRRGYPAVREL